MSEPPKQPAEDMDVNRSGFKGERDAKKEVLATPEAGTPDEDNVVRELVVPKSQPEDEDGDRSPTKTE